MQLAAKATTHGAFDPSSEGPASAQGVARLPLRQSRGGMFALPPSSLSRAPDAVGFEPVHAAPPVSSDASARDCSRVEAGIVLDRELVALAAAEARCRLVRARIAACLIAVWAWRALGFVRLSDFARERLGVSPRSLEDDAHTVRALDPLPVLRAALENGSLSWSRLRVLLRAASPQNEARLIEESRAVAMRNLEAFVAAFGTQDSEDPKTGNGEARAGEHRRPLASDDPCVRWSILVSRGGSRMWRAACEHASRSAGSPLSQGQVLERVAAEAAGAAACGGDALPPWAPTPEMHEHRLREAIRLREVRGRRSLLAFLAETGVAEGFAWLDPTSGDPGPARSVDALALDLDGCDAFELERRLQSVRALSQRLDAQIAALMRTGIDRRLFREIGFATVKLYAEARLGLSARRVWNLVALERDSWHQSPLLHEAFREGRLTPLQATALLPVISEPSAQAWIERAGQVTLRRLHDEVAWALDRPRQTDDHGAVFAPPPPDADVRAEALAGVTDEEVQIRAHGLGEGPDSGPPAEVPLDFVMPVSVAVLVETTLDQLQRPREARGMAFERMVALALLEWRSVPRHRDPVFERDGWRCAVPGCSSRQSLHDHHVQFRSQGGGNARDNRITVCAAHHLHGIHEGIVRVNGLAPHELLWELGCAPGKEPLMRLRGDRHA
jgi:hypothetical protein